MKWISQLDKPSMSSNLHIIFTILVVRLMVKWKPHSLPVTTRLATFMACCTTDSTCALLAWATSAQSGGSSFVVLT